jgi:hypothetical protein
MDCLKFCNGGNEFQFDQNPIYYPIQPPYNPDFMHGNEILETDPMVWGLCETECSVKSECTNASEYYHELDGRGRQSLYEGVNWPVSAVYCVHRAERCLCAYADYFLSMCTYLLQPTKRSVFIP